MAKVAIKEQKEKVKKEPLPEEKVYYDQIMAAKKSLQEMRQKRKEARMGMQKDEMVCTWIFTRYIQKELAKGNKHVLELCQSIKTACIPREGYDAEKVESDKSSIQRFIDRNFVK